MDKVFRLLSKSGKSQVALARFVGVTKGAVTNWKRGGNIQSAHAKKIVEFFCGQITLDDIYYRKPLKRKPTAANA